MATIHVDIVSAEGEIHSGEARMVFAPARMGEVSRNFANTKLAMSTLAFNPSVDFRDGISALYDWIKFNEY